MKNETFKKAAEAVEAFRKDYRERVKAEEQQLSLQRERERDAEARAAEAIQDNDREAWKQADRDRADAAAEIRFCQERLAMIRTGEKYPIPEYEKLLEQIDVEQSRAVLEFVKELQEIYKSALASYGRLQDVMDEGQEALRILYAAGSGKENGYRQLEGPRANFGYMVTNGGIFGKSLLSFDVKTGAGLNGGEPLHRAIMAARAAIRRGGGTV